MLGNANMSSLLEYHPEIRQKCLGQSTWKVSNVFQEDKNGIFCVTIVYFVWNGFFHKPFVILEEMKLLLIGTAD